MLTLEQITAAVKTVADEYHIKNISLFGSYADGTNTAESDVDLLIEFYAPAVSLFLLSEIKYRIEELLNTEVDIIHAPISENAIIKPDKVVQIYAA